MAKRKITPAEADAAVANEAEKRQKSEEKAPLRIPVTILSGFLGSGKTTLMQYILTSKDHKLKVAVIVNDMAELNIDGQTIRKTANQNRDEEKKDEEEGMDVDDDNAAAHRVVKTKKEVVTLENGCICCTLRGDLIREIHEIQQMNQFDYILIESTGIAEPQQVAESFVVDPETQEIVSADSNAEEAKMLWNMARLDTCVTVVDAVNFSQYLSSLDRFKDIFQDGLDPHQPDEEGEGEKSISELMIAQVEFANVILLNKIDLVSDPKQLQMTKALIQRLNPKARVVTASYGKVDLENILNTQLFDLKEAEESPGWAVSLKDGVSADHGEADEYGVSSFVYRARKPFHPQRLYTFLQQSFCFAEEWNGTVMSSSNKNNEETEEMRKKAEDKFGCIMRSKGSCWIAGRDENEIGWAQTGRIISLRPSNPWYCVIPQELWQGDVEEIEARMRSKAESDDEEGVLYEYGDRRQEVVIIGTQLKEKAIVEALDNCLLTDSEMKHHGISLPEGAYPDMLPPLLVACDGAQTLYMIARPGQNQHLRVFAGFALTIHNISLNVVKYEEEQNIYAVKVWLDKSDSVPRQPGSMLLATLRPDMCLQHSLSFPILPNDEEGGEEESNQRIRVEAVMKHSGGKTYTPDEMLGLLEVHIMGAVEPVPYQSNEGNHHEEGHDHGHDHGDDEEGGPNNGSDKDDCPDGTCPL